MKHYIIVLTVLAAFSLSACNTTRGLGEDIAVVGDKIEEVAEDAKN